MIRTAMVLAFVFTVADFVMAREYPPVKWEESSDEKLLDTFQKVSGQNLWRVRYGKNLYGDATGQGRAPAVNVAWGLTPPKPSSGRISRGKIFHLYKADAHSGAAWFPGKDYIWKEVEILRHSYVVVKAPPSAKAKASQNLVERIYDRPVVVGEKISDEESALLLDAVFAELQRARRGEGDLVVAALDGQGRPEFGEISGIQIGVEMDGMIAHAPKSRRFVGLGQGGAGTLVLEFDLEDGKAKLVGLYDVAF